MLRGRTLGSGVPGSMESHGSDATLGLKSEERNEVKDEVKDEVKNEVKEGRSEGLEPPPSET